MRSHLSFLSHPAFHLRKRISYFRWYQSGFLQLLRSLTLFILQRTFNFSTLQPASSVPLPAICCERVFPIFFLCYCSAAVIPMALLPQAQWCCYLSYFWEADVISVRMALLYHCSSCCPRQPMVMLVGTIICIQKGQQPGSMEGLP